jgi:hypothetical protein
MNVKFRTLDQLQVDTERLLQKFAFLHSKLGPPQPRLAKISWSIQPKPFLKFFRIRKSRRGVRTFAYDLFRVITIQQWIILKGGYEASYDYIK